MLSEHLRVWRPIFWPALALAGASPVSMYIYRTSQEHTAAKMDCERHAQFNVLHTSIQLVQSEQCAYITDVTNNNLQNAADVTHDSLHNVASDYSRICNTTHAGCLLPCNVTCSSACACLPFCSSNSGPGAARWQTQHD